MLDLVTNDKGMTTLKYKIPTRGLLGRAVQVEHIRLTWVKSTWLSTS